MNGIVISIDPIIFRLGAFEFRWYSLAIMMAIAAAVLITARLGKKKGIATEEVYSLAVWAVLAGIIGARLLHVIDQLDYYASNPSLIMQFQRGGLAIWGALAAGGIAALAYARIRRIPLGRLADALAPALLTAHIIGRFGCIINGDAYGRATDLPWAFIYTHPNAMIPSSLFGIPTHPYPAYEILWNGIALLIILRLSRHFQRDGQVFLSYLSLYSLGRFVLSFVRQENVIVAGLQQAQVVAMSIFIISLADLLYLTMKPEAKKGGDSLQTAV